MKKKNTKNVKLSIGEALIILDGLVGLIADIIAQSDIIFGTAICMHGYWDLKNTVKTYSELDDLKKELQFYNGNVINKF